MIVLLIHLVVDYDAKHLVAHDIKHVVVHDVKYFLDHNLLMFPVSAALARNPLWFAFPDDHPVFALFVIF
jgi:hypothetical protein